MAKDASLPVVVVGAGLAASEMATSLRANGYTGQITIVGDEPHLPYHRPPLSKAFLSGDLPVERLFVKTAAVYQNANIDLILGVGVGAVDRVAKVVSLADGRTLAYHKLVLATGGRPRKLALPDERANSAPNLYYLRSIDSACSLRERFKAGIRLVIVGGGYIGLEVASIARKKAMDVTVLEAAPRVLARVTAPEVSAFYHRIHSDAGVKIRVDVQIEGFEFDDAGCISGVLVAGGEMISADVLIVGIGLIPNTELAEAAGLTLENGIAVDEYGGTSDPDIFAIGDCSSQRNAYACRRLRLESVPSALEQARSVAALLMGKPRPCDAVPWFWSDQLDLKLQMVGLSEGYDAVVLRGSPESRSFLSFYLRDGVLLAVDSVGRAQDFVIAKRLVAERVRVDAVRLADESVALKNLLPAALTA